MLVGHRRIDEGDVPLDGADEPPDAAVDGPPDVVVVVPVGPNPDDVPEDAGKNDAIGG